MVCVICWRIGLAPGFSNWTVILQMAGAQCLCSVLRVSVIFTLPADNGAVEHSTGRIYQTLGRDSLEDDGAVAELFLPPRDASFFAADELFILFFD